MWGERIRRRRGAMSQTELARRIGRTQGTVSRIELGTVRLTDEMKLRIAHALGCHVGELFDWPAGEAGDR
jgi:transcriptional regulator with XRE-family HTH domain